jgi:hypothetical protein
VEEQRLEYGFLHTKVASGGSKSLLPVTMRHLRQCKADANMVRCAHTDLNMGHHYNNFHASKISYWLRPEVRRFLAAVLASGGLRKFWGDSEVQTMGAKLFMDPARLRVIPNVAYEHGSHEKTLISDAHGRLL